jgi:branched-subunit amino acid transport protein
MNEIFLIAGMAIVTFATRYPVLALLSRRTMPEGVFRALKYVPPAVLSAIIFPAVLLPAGQLEISLDNAPLFASLIAAFVSWRTRNLLLTILIGMASLWFWRWLIAF